MDMAITDGLVLMPPPFADGLAVWSRENGTPGSGTWEGQANAAFVPADQDFGGCLEMLKTDPTQQLRYSGDTPILPGLYLRISTRVKAVSGNMPSVRIAAWAGDGSGAAVTGIPLTGPEVALTAYGAVVEVSAIVGVGNRVGVDMPWGMAPTFGHFGIDLVGASGGIVRIDEIRIEDVTGIFARKLMDWVDVRDYGAKGDGVTDDSAAFEAADAAAAGRSVLVSAGTYHLGTNVTFEAPVRFEGTVTMPPEARLSLTRSYDLATYGAAFGNEAEGFRRALQALFYFTDHATLDLGGRRVELDAPVDVAALAGITGGFATRRVVTNGQINLVAGTGWDTVTVTSQASYSAAQALTLSGVANVAQVPVGALVSASGVGREVYVTSKNVGAGTLTLSQPLHHAEGTRTYTFSRFAYALDFSGFQSLGKFEITDVEIQCNGIGSAILLAPAGQTFRLADSVVNRPKDRAITSIGAGCQGMMLERNQFLSNEQSARVQDRTTIVVNVNANDVKMRDNRAVRFAHFAIMNGSGHLITGNHFFQGDDETLGVRWAGLVLTQTNVKTVISGNYVDNCFIEWTNEHDAQPDFANEYSFGGLTVTGNIFMATNMSTAFRWFVVTPYGAGHFLQGLTLSDNVFRTVNGTVDRVEAVDATVAPLDFTRFRNVSIQGNAFNGVTATVQNPVIVEHSQNTAATAWVVDPSAFLAFGGRARVVPAITAEGPIFGAGGEWRTEMPYAAVEQGALGQQVVLAWPNAVHGKVQVTARVDNPL